MAAGITKDAHLGSGDLYMLAYSGSIGTDETIESANNKIGTIKGGATISYKPNPYDITDDKNQLVDRYIIKDEASFKTGVLTWNVDVLHQLLGVGSVEDDAESFTKTLSVGGGGASGITQYLLRFVHTDKLGKKHRITMVVVNDGGLSLAFAGDKETVVDAEFKAVAMDANGTLFTYSQEYPNA